MTGQDLSQSRVGSRNAAADSVYLLVGSTLSTILSLLAGLLLVRVLMPEHYGMVAYFLKVFGLARFVGTLGLGAKVIEDVSRASALAESHGLGRTVYTLGLVRLFSGTVLVLLLTAFARLNGQPAFFWAGLASLFACLADYTSAVCQGLKKRTVVATLSVAQPLLFLSTSILLAVTDAATPELIYASFTFSFVPALALYAWVLWRTEIPLFDRSYLSLQYLRGAMIALGSLFVAGILNYLYQSLGTLMLGQSRLFEDAAYFNAALTVLTMPGTLGLIVATAVFYPDLVTTLARGDRDSAASMLEGFLRVSCLVLIVPTVLCMVYSDLVVSVLYTNKYAQSVIPLTLASPLILLLFLQQLLTFGLYALKRYGLATKGYAVQVLLTWGSMLAIIYWVGAGRAVVVAIAYLIAGTLGFLIQWQDLNKLLPCRFSLSRLGAALLVAAVVMALGRQIGHALMPQPPTALELLGIAFLSLVSLLAIVPLLVARDQRRSYWSRLMSRVSAAGDRLS